MSTANNQKEKAVEFVGFYTAPSKARDYKQAANAKCKGNRSLWIKQVLDRALSENKGAC